MFLWLCQAFLPEMETIITNSIKVSVECFFQEEYSKPLANQYVFSYRVTIENLGNYTVQLLTRYWQIIDAMGTVREVTGEGVIGKQPVLSPGQSHQYVSWCPLDTPLGKMRGTYTMLNMQDHTTFEATIPAFKLISPFTLN